MNSLIFDNAPLLHALLFAARPSVDEAPVAVDAEGQLKLVIDGTQTVGASSLDIRNLTAAQDAAGITAADFDMRNLSGVTDGVTQYQNGYYVTSATTSLLLGGTTVLTVDTAAYARSAFLVRANSISLLTAANLQLAPVNSANYFVTDSTQSNLLLGGTYLFVPSVSIRYMRIFATGVGSQLTAYYVGQI